ncbi:MAG: ABC transporter permease [Chloroflexi bacterium]|nr:ABC transporter permease [Chloroflexota bacterium]
MGRYVFRRTIQSLFLLVGISLLSFVLMHLAPGGPVTMLEDPKMKPEVIAEIRRSFGLDDPVPVQYARWLWGVVRLDFGRSFIDNRPVIDKILERVPATFQLSLAAFIIGLLGIPMGIYAALRRGSWADNVVRVFIVVGNAVPHWWLGLMILLISASTVRVFPLGGMYTPGQDTLLNRFWHLSLPALIGAMSGWIVFGRFLRPEVLELLRQDYIRTAHAKGLNWPVVLRRHALRNALIPVVTILGGSLAGLFSGAVLLETTFSWPGMGRLAVSAAFQRDYPLLMALTIVFSILVILGNLLADLAYGLVDPRVRYD